MSFHTVSNHRYFSLRTAQYSLVELVNMPKSRLSPHRQERGHQRRCKVHLEGALSQGGWYRQALVCQAAGRLRHSRLAVAVSLIPITLSGSGPWLCRFQEHYFLSVSLGLIFLSMPSSRHIDTGRAGKANCSGTLLLVDSDERKHASFACWGGQGSGEITRGQQEARSPCSASVVARFVSASSVDGPVSCWL